MAFAVSLRLYNFLICQKMNINCSIHILLNFKVGCSFFSTWCQWNQLSDFLSGQRLDLSTFSDDMVTLLKSSGAYFTEQST